jgi:hypothetical protein
MRNEFSNLSTHLAELLLSPKAKIESSDNLALQEIAPLIHQIREERVILDADLARIYGVTTKRLNEQVKRNAERFPEDFAFKLTKEETANLMSQIATSRLEGLPNRSQNVAGFNVSEHSRSQIATLKRGQNIKYLPHAFTEHGAIMAANVLNSKQAVQMSVFVVRAFVKLREALASHRELADKLTELERKVGTHDKALVSIIAAIRGLTESPKPKTRAIGFRAKREGQTGAAPKQLARRDVRTASGLRLSLWERPPEGRVRVARFAQILRPSPGASRRPLPERPLRNAWFLKRAKKEGLFGEVFLVDCLIRHLFFRFRDTSP